MPADAERNFASQRRDQSTVRIRRMLRARRREPVLRFEAQHVFNRDTIEMTADLPDRKKFGVDKLVDGLSTELPPAA